MNSTLPAQIQNSVCFTCARKCAVLYLSFKDETDRGYYLCKRCIKAQAKDVQVKPK